MINTKKLSKQKIKIAIDLTPLLPSGLNGGAKIMTLRLIQQLSTLAPNYQFILLANKINFIELSKLKNENIKILNLSKTHNEDLKTSINHNKYNISQPSLLKQQIISIINAFPKIKKITQHLFSQCKNYLLGKKIKRLIQPDLLFCPFTAPAFHAIKVPIISVIYDLQFLYHPYFFSDSDLYSRKKHFQAACKRSTKLICISEFTKKTILDNSSLSPENIKTIYIKQAHRLPNPASDQINKILKNYNLTENNYLLYPANFWAHKNHSLLMTAFNIYLNQHPESTLKLVCTGANNLQKSQLINDTKKMRLNDSIIFPGYLSDIEFSYILKGCLALIFPSLYEGFGMPIIEAMAAGKPVLCSNISSLPEIAGDAALLFDPRKPEDIANAIHQISSDQLLFKKLIDSGAERVKAFTNETDMANEYLSIFQNVLDKTSRIDKQYDLLQNEFTCSNSKDI